MKKPTKKQSSWIDSHLIDKPAHDESHLKSLWHESKPMTPADTIRDLHYEIQSLSYGSYRNISIVEYRAISHLMEYNDSSRLDELIRSDLVPTDSMKRLVSALVSGKVKRPARTKASTSLRDSGLSGDVRVLVEAGHKAGHSIRSAALMASEAYNKANRTYITLDTAIRAYKLLNFHKDTRLTITEFVSD